MINVVIYSYNRAMQLDLLLKSFKEKFQEWEICNTTIIYRSSNDDFEKGYARCKEAHPQFSFVNEKSVESFKKATIDAVNDDNPLTFFLVDDIVFKDSFSLADPEFGEFASNEKVLGLSLRLYKEVNYCYPINKSVSVPQEILKGEFLWDWTSGEGDWNYPLSLDGHIFNTEIIKPFLLQLNYTNPNTLEAGMSVNVHFVSHLPLFACYRDQSKIVNIVANRVQSTFNNRCGNLASPEVLNEAYLSGKKINEKQFDQYKNNAPHVEVNYELI